MPSLEVDLALDFFQTTLTLVTPETWDIFLWALPPIRYAFAYSLRKIGTIFSIRHNLWSKGTNIIWRKAEAFHIRETNDGLHLPKQKEKKKEKERHAIFNKFAYNIVKMIQTENIFSTPNWKYFHNKSIIRLATMKCFRFSSNNVRP